MNKLAIITGVTGQDGSYLSELLLDKSYTVVGLHRRSSVNNFERISHLIKNPNFILEEFDITDPSDTSRLIDQYHPHELYNLAAQSHVATSFKQPTTTFEIDSIGVINILQAISRISPQTKFYQASTSEMFGSNYSSRIDVNGQIINYQDENTPFLPNSPYAVAKLASHRMVQIYRESYGLYCCSGVLFNHETITYGTPVIIKIGNKIDILPIGDVARFHTGIIFNLDKKEYQEGKPITDIKIWDQTGWVDISWVSGYYHNKDKNPRIINARNYVYAATGSHPCIMENDTEILTSDLKLGDRIKNIQYPNIEDQEHISLEEAEWLGMLVGDGCIVHNDIRLTNKSELLKYRFGNLWQSFNSDGSFKLTDSSSGFTRENVGQIRCYGANKKFDIYTSDYSPFGHKNKKVPSKILNSSIDIMEAFLIGYNNCDGLKSNLCKYKFKNFKTNSPTLAAGLLFLVSKVTGQKYNITVEESWKWGKQQFYYSVNLLSDRQKSKTKYEIVKKLLDQSIPQRKIHRDTGISRAFIKKVKRGFVPSDTHHLELCSNEIKKIINIPNYEGWFFDLETSSGTFHAGIGQGVIHNSPKRGENFVTRKITKYIGQLVNKKIDYNTPLLLGNLNASRDWGHAKDYVEAMHLMLQQEQADDFVISTGETHSVKDFVNEAFKLVTLDPDRYVKIDPELYRPCEVNYLRGDGGKAREKLGWTPKISFKELVKEMVVSDIKKYAT